MNTANSIADNSFALAVVTTLASASISQEQRESICPMMYKSYLNDHTAAEGIEPTHRRHRY